jgi:hypothetical protein
MYACDLIASMFRRNSLLAFWAVKPSPRPIRIPHKNDERKKNPKVMNCTVDQRFIPVREQ